MKSSHPGTLAGVALAAIGLLVAASPAFADTELGHRGDIGRHELIDSTTRPGARCHYEEIDAVGGVRLAVVASELVGVRVRPPRMLAIDATDAADVQPVSWQFILREKMDGGRWERVGRSRIQRAKATDSEPAEFTPLGLRFEGNQAAHYSVVVRMRWHRPERPALVNGVAVHGVDVYAVPDDAPTRSCPGVI